MMQLLLCAEIIRKCPPLYGKDVLCALSLWTRGADSSIETCAGIRDVETGKIISRFADDSYFHSAYVEDDTIYVTGVDKNKRSTIRIYKSHDLISRTNEVLFDNPGRRYFNAQERRI